MTPQNTNVVDIKSGNNQNTGFDMDDPSFLKRFGSNATGMAPGDDDFDPNLSMIKETD
jgi:hypothetical protein